MCVYFHLLVSSYLGVSVHLVLDTHVLVLGDLYYR
jgi:hypothetical protein